MPRSKDRGIFYWAVIDLDLMGAGSTIGASLTAAQSLPDVPVPCGSQPAGDDDLTVELIPRLHQIKSDHRDDSTIRRFDRLAPTINRVTNRGDAHWTSLEP